MNSGRIVYFKYIKNKLDFLLQSYICKDTKNNSLY